MGEKNRSLAVCWRVRMEREKRRIRNRTSMVFMGEGKKRNKEEGVEWKKIIYKDEGEHEWCL